MGINESGNSLLPLVTPLAKFVLPVPMTLCSVGLEVSAPKGGASIRRHKDDSIELEIKTAAQPLWDPYAFGLTGREGIYYAGWSD